MKAIVSAYPSSKGEIDALDFSRSEILGINPNDDLPSVNVNANFIYILSFPSQLDADMGKRLLDELADRVGLASGENKVFRLLLLEDHPHTLNVVASYDTRINTDKDQGNRSTNHGPNHEENQDFRGTSTTACPA